MKEKKGSYIGVFWGPLDVDLLFQPNFYVYFTKLIFLSWLILYFLFFFYLQYFISININSPHLF